MHGGALYEQAAEDVVPNPAQLAVAKALNSVKGELGTANVTSGLWGSSAACKKLEHNKSSVSLPDPDYPKLVDLRELADTDFASVQHFVKLGLYLKK